MKVSTRPESRELHEACRAHLVPAAATAGRAPADSDCGNAESSSPILEPSKAGLERSGRQAWSPALLAAFVFAVVSLAILGVTMYRPAEGAPTSDRALSRGDSPALPVFKATADRPDCCPHNPARCPTQASKGLHVPDGFCIDHFATNITSARGLSGVHETPAGPVLFVGSTRAGTVSAVILSDSHDRALRTVVLSKNRNNPNSVAYLGGDLYIVEVDRLTVIRSVTRYLLQSSDDPRGNAPVHTLYDSFSPNRHHGLRYARFGPDGKLYVAIGVPCNTCRVEGLQCPVDKCFFGEIIRTKVVGRERIEVSDWETYAEGIRNSEGFDFDLEHGGLWFTDNGRDQWGNNRPPDELNYAPKGGLHFGFPYCYGKGDADPEYNPSGDCSNYEDSAFEMGPHVATLGMTFAQNNRLPAPWNDGIFVAEHGSWNRNPFLGYRITFLSAERVRSAADQRLALGGADPNAASGGAGSGDREDPPAGEYKVFVDGFLTDPSRGQRFGRPMDVRQFRDGSIVFSDDQAGVLWRVWFPASPAGKH